MKLVVGLGNPGPRYAGTRHNIGVRVAAEVAGRAGFQPAGQRFQGLYGEGRIGDEPVAVLLPQTYMNRSGAAVAEAMAGLGLDDPALLFVVYDDMSLEFGRLRVRAAGGAGSHNGMEDVIACVGTPAIARLRFGIGAPPPEVSWTDHVLAPFSADEERSLGSLLPAAAIVVETALTESVAAAMNRWNAAPPQEP